jgi:integrase
MLPRRGATQLALPARERALSADELVAVAYVSATELPKPRACVRLLIHTGCRRAEAAAIAAGEVENG